MADAAVAEPGPGTVSPAWRWLAWAVAAFLVAACAATLCFKEINGPSFDLPEQLARTKTRNLADSVQVYRLKYKRWPATLDDLEARDATGHSIETEVPRDPWGHAYELRIEGAEVSVRSFGPDGIANTADDVSSRPR